MLFAEVILPTESIETTVVLPYLIINLPPDSTIEKFEVTKLVAFVAVPAVVAEVAEAARDPKRRSGRAKTGDKVIDAPQILDNLAGQSRRLRVPAFRQQVDKQPLAGDHGAYLHLLREREAQCLAIGVAPRRAALGREAQEHEAGQQRHRGRGACARPFDCPLFKPMPRSPERDHQRKRLAAAEAFPRASPIAAARTPS